MSESGLSSAVKALIVVIAGLFVLALLGGAVAWYLFSKNKDRIIKASNTAIQEGTEAGKSMNEQQCMDATLKRLEEKKSLIDSVQHNLFFTSCLNNCSPSENFCEGVPAGDQFIESVKWRTRRCKELNLDENRCGTLLAVIQNHCDAKRYAVTPN